MGSDANEELRHIIVSSMKDLEDKLYGVNIEVAKLQVHIETFKEGSSKVNQLVVFKDATEKELHAIKVLLEKISARQDGFSKSLNDATVKDAVVHDKVTTGWKLMFAVIIGALTLIVSKVLEGVIKQ